MEDASQDGVCSPKASTAPKDSKNIVFFIQFLYGMAILLPFNIVIACVDFYEDKMPGYYPASTYPFALQSLLFFGSLFFTVFEDRFMRTDLQIIWGFAISAVLLTAIPVFANMGGSTGYWLVFLTLLIVGWFDGVVQGCLYKENAMLPGNYIGIFLTAQGLAGIFSNVLRFASLEIWPDNPFTSVAFCYVWCVIICILCIPAQINMNKNKYALYFQKAQATGEVQYTEMKLDEKLNVGETDQALVNTVMSTQDLSPSDSEGMRQNSEIATDQPASCSSFLKKARINFWATKGLLPALAYAFVLTFILFPGVVQDTTFRFMSGWDNEDSWFVLTTLTMFNIFDTIGRSAAGWTCMDISRQATLVLNYARTLFIATFLFVAFEVGPDWLFTSDWFKLVNLSLFAFTNGWLSSLCVIKAPNFVSQSARGDVGALINPAIVGGILLGTILAIPMEQVIKLTPKGKLQ